MSVYRDGDGRWRYRARVAVKEGSIRISGTAPKKANTQAAAIGAERAHIARLLTTDPTVVAMTKGGKAPTFEEWAEKYMKEVAPTQSPSEQLSKRRKLDAVLLPLLAKVRMDELNRGHLAEVRAQLVGKAPSTVNNHLAVVGALLSRAVEFGHREHSIPLGFLKLEAQPFEYYTDDELHGLLEGARGDVMLTCALLLGADAGLRAGEIRALHRADVRGGVIQVIRSDFEGELKGTKSGRARAVEMTDALSAAVEAALKSHLGPRVLARPDGSPWTKESMVWCAPPKGWHALRHTFCSRLAAAGVPALEIQAAAGHASVTTTQRYMHLAANRRSPIHVLNRPQMAAREEKAK